MYTYLVEPHLSMYRIRFHLSAEKSCDTCNSLHTFTKSERNETERKKKKKKKKMTNKWVRNRKTKEE